MTFYPLNPLQYTTPSPEPIWKQYHDVRPPRDTLPLPDWDQPKPVAAINYALPIHALDPVLVHHLQEPMEIRKERAGLIPYVNWLAERVDHEFFYG